MTIGSISEPHYSKVWSGTDGRFRDNPYDMSSETDYDGVWTYHPGGTTVNGMDGAGVGLVYPNTTVTSGDVLDALSNSLNGNSFNLGMFLGEGNDSVKMVRNAAARAQEALFHIDDDNIAKALKVLKQTPTAKLVKLTAIAAASGYLCWKFGWQQLFSDMKTGSEQVAELIQKTDERTSVRKQRVKRLNIFGSTPGCAAVDVGYQEEGIRVIAELHLTFGELAAEKLGVGDLPSLAYDLVPLSFVANWILPIGNYLQRAHTLDLFAGAQVVTTSWKKVRINASLFEGRLAGVPGFWTGSRLRGTMVMHRTVSQGLPFANPPLQWQVPTTFSQAVTGVALLTQRLLSPAARLRPSSGINNNSLSFGGRALTVLSQKLR